MIHDIIYESVWTHLSCFSADNCVFYFFVVFVYILDPPLFTSKRLVFESRRMERMFTFGIHYFFS